VLNNLVAIVGLVVFAALFTPDPSGDRSASEITSAMVTVLGGSATLGVVVQAVVLFYFWRRIGLRYRPDFRFRGVGLGAAGKMASWTFGMLLLTTAAGIVETQVVTLAHGKASVAVLTTAWLIFMLPHSVITVSVATAYFTRMSEHATMGSWSLVRTDASSAIRGTSLLIVLAAAVIAVCAYPFAAVFVAPFAQVQAIGYVIIAFIVGLVPFCVLFVVQRTFYALGDTRTPFFFTLFQVVLLIIAVLACSLLPTDLIAVGIAGSITVTGTLQAVLAMLLLRHRMHGIDGRRIVRSMVKYLVAVAIPLAAGLALLMILGGTTEGGFAVSSRLSAMVSMLIIGVVMSAAYFGLLLVMRSGELTAFLAPLQRRFGR
jgi:putative peptidoglycan lipid II flippase